jgi:hypothetical protein
MSRIIRKIDEFTFFEIPELMAVLVLLEFMRTKNGKQVDLLKKP